MKAPTQYSPERPCQECGHDRQTHTPGGGSCWERVRFDDGKVIAYMGLCPCEGFREGPKCSACGRTFPLIAAEGEEAYAGHECFVTEGSPCLCGAPSAPGRQFGSRTASPNAEGEPSDVGGDVVGEPDCVVSGAIA